MARILGEAGRYVSREAGKMQQGMLLVVSFGVACCPGLAVSVSIAFLQKALLGEHLHEQTLNLTL